MQRTTNLQFALVTHGCLFSLQPVQRMALSVGASSSLVVFLSVARRQKDEEEWVGTHCLWLHLPLVSLKSTQPSTMSTADRHSHPCPVCIRMWSWGWESIVYMKGRAGGEVWNILPSLTLPPLPAKCFNWFSPLLAPIPEMCQTGRKSLEVTQCYKVS